MDQMFRTSAEAKGKGWIQENTFKPAHPKVVNYRLFQGGTSVKVPLGYMLLCPCVYDI